MQYTSRIILDNKLKMMEPMIYGHVTPITGWETRELIYTEPLKFVPVDETWSPIEMGSHWKITYDRTRMFRTRVRIPEDFGAGQIVLVLDLGGEGQVRIDGEIVSGVTSYTKQNYLAPSTRSRVYVPEKYGPGSEFELEVECSLNFLEFSYAITLKAQEQYAEYTLRTAFLALVDEEVERYWFDLNCAVEAMDTFENPLSTLQDSNARILDPTVEKIMLSLNSESYMHKKLFNTVMASVSMLDLEFDLDRLKASIPAASKVLKEGIEAIPYKANAMVKFVGQAHIDTAWLWPLKETVRKCGKTFSNTIALMEKYPEYIFAFSQPQLFAYTEEFYPELFEKVKQRVLEGRIELVGNAWVEMDTNVPSGEALVRQLLYGRQYFMEKFGKASRVFWMPDVFGYSWALPQIMKRSGVDYFFTSKLVNNDTNRFPHSLFMWQGVDGTKILSYLQRRNYNGNLCAKTLSEINQLFDQKDVCDTALMTVGYGDGGGGISWQMLEKARRLKNFPGLPASEIATSLSFFEEAEKVQDELPVWNDEMYYEFHRGTYTSQANNKKGNRKGELLLRRTEMACALRSLLLNAEYPAREIGGIWKPLLTNQFHDILPGSSIHQVYEDTAGIYAKIMKDATALFDGAVADLNRALGVKKDQIAVWNFLGWKHTGTADAVLNGSYLGLTDETGTPVACTAVREGDTTRFTFRAEDVPALGVRTFTAVKDSTEQERVYADPRTLENRYLKVTLDEDGNITSLWDKEAGREVFAAGSRNNLLTIFEDIPHRESAWNIDIEYMNHFWVLDRAESVTVAESSPVRGVIRVVRSFNKSVITQEIVLAKDARRVDFITHADWWETERMLKAAFTADVLATKASYEIQFGTIERPTHWNTSYDKARFEVCGHKWADLSEGGYGVSLLNDCKYGYDIKDNVMRLTLLRSPNYPDPTGDKGVHDFVYSVYPHTGDWRDGDTVKEAYELNVPLCAFAGTGDAKAESTGVPYVKCDQVHAVIDSFKGAEDGDGFIVRVYESKGARGNAVLEFGFDLKEAEETNLMEDFERKLPVEGNRLMFYIRPYEIRTFRVRKR